MAMYYQRADITWMVLTDVAPNEVRPAWPTAQYGRLIEDYWRLPVTRSRSSGTASLQKTAAPASRTRASGKG